MIGARGGSIEKLSNERDTSCKVGGRLSPSENELSRLVGGLDGGLDDFSRCGASKLGGRLSWDDISSGEVPEGEMPKGEVSEDEGEPLSSKS